MINQSIRILLADDHQIILDSLPNLLSSVEGIEVIGKVTNGKLALELLGHTEVDMPVDELKKAIFSLQNNQKYFSDEVITELVSSSGENVETFQRKQTIPLTEREIEVLKLIAQEYSTPHIAEKLFISIATVETHRQRMSQKIGVKGAVGLVLYAIKQGLLE